MNIDTGKIIDNDEYNNIENEEFKNRYVEIMENEMTNKQKESKQVSLLDHKSRLGKKLTNIRRLNGITKNQLRGLRKKGFIK